MLTEVRAAERQAAPGTMFVLGGGSDSVCRGLGGNRKTDWTASPSLYAAGTPLQVDRSPPACSQISTCSPKSTRGEAEKRLPSFAPGPLMPLQIWCQSPRFETNLCFCLCSLVIPAFLLRVKTIFWDFSSLTSDKSGPYLYEYELTEHGSVIRCCSSPDDLKMGSWPLPAPPSHMNPLQPSSLRSPLCAAVCTLAARISCSPRS